jgi:transcriptional regulator CtsR
LSTRFSYDRGFIVESRRGSGGFVRIVRKTTKPVERTPAVMKERLPVPSISLSDLDSLLYRLIRQQTITNREAVLLHHTFEALYAEVDERQRYAVIHRILKHLELQ